MNQLIQVFAQATPNPNSLKFTWGETIAEGGPFDFPDFRSAENSPLALRLFGCNGVMGVFIARDFVTVTKHEGVSWERLQEQVVQQLKKHAASDDIAVKPEAEKSVTETDPRDLEARIQKILNDEIRPAVAMDGGDVVFKGFNAGVVMLQLRGACAGCPSSMATLKMGIENRLKQAIPEVTEVVQMM